MVTNDPLDKEISLSVSLTETGIGANAKSRTIAAIDRLCGNLVDWANLSVERRVSRARAVLQGEQRLIESIAEHGVEQLNLDPAFARRAAKKHFEKIFSEQENKEEVVREAVEHLKHEPPTDEQPSTGDAKLSEEFLGRFEQYAAGATTEQLRQRWGRVLASEIRKPGTFSLKVLRVIDELDAATALEFETRVRFED